LQDQGVHVVFINSGAVSTEVPEVAVDQQAAGYTATRHLLDLGHERIGFVCVPAQALPARLLQIGWTAALEEAGHPVDPALLAHGRVDSSARLSAPQGRLSARCGPMR